MQIGNWHLKCPECGNPDAELQIELRFWVDAKSLAEYRQAPVTASGYSHSYGRELADMASKAWKRDSPCCCGACGHSATVEDFNCPPE